MSLPERLLGHARFQGDAVAIEFTDQAITYRDLQQHVDDCCQFLTDAGLRVGDRIGVLALNHPEWFVLLFAAARLGLVLVPLNWRLSETELDYLLSDSAPALLFYDKTFADTAHQLLGRRTEMAARELGIGVYSRAPGTNTPDATDIHTAVIDRTEDDLLRPLLIVYTSGTTGRPKGAVLNQQALICSATMSQHMLDLNSTDRVLNVLPLFHVGGLNIQPLPTLLCGGTLLLQPRFEPAAAIAGLQRGVTLINSVPTLLEAILDHPEWADADLSALRAITIGSTDVPVQLIERVHQRNIPLLQVYGATETGPVAIYQRPEMAQDVGSIGLAGLLCSVRLVDPDGQDVAVGESGEILVSGDNLLSGYWNNSVATRDALVDGWFHTGDVAHRDEQGRFWFDDRLKHVVISGGENIYPAELERVLRDVPGITEVAVIGKKDAKWGEVPVAVVVADDGLTAEVVRQSCSTLARYKQPREVVFVKALPRNALGKVLVHELRDLLAAEGHGQPGTDE